MITTADKDIKLSEECACIEGSIGTVDRVDLVFDYKIKDETGSVSMNIFDLLVKYKFTPKVLDKVEEYVSYHEKGMIYLAVDSFSLSAIDHPITLIDKVSTRNEQSIESVLNKFFTKSDESQDRNQLDILEELINDKVITYEQHSRLY